MDPRTVSKLEQKILEAIFEIVVKMGLKKLTLLPSHQTVHLMAKAAVAVYEAAVENSKAEKPPQDAPRN
jgi:malic enzyme